MNLLIVILLFTVFLVPLWLLFGKSDDKTGRISEEAEREQAEPVLDREGRPVTHDLPEAEIPPRSSQFEKELQERLTPVGDDFILPNSNTSIINEDSPFNIYRRTLDNAQYYMENGDFDTARDLYNGLLQRISDKNIRRKIEENIDYLNNYQQIAASREQEKKNKTAASGDNEIRVTMGGQEFVPERIKIDITPPHIQPTIDMDEILEAISGHVAKISPLIRESNDTFSEMSEYRGELERVTEKLRSLYDLKEESNRIREQRIDTDLARIQELKEKIQRENLERTKNTEIDILRQEIEKLKHGRMEEMSRDSEIQQMRSQMDLLRQQLAQSSQAGLEIDGLKETIQSLRDELHVREQEERDITSLTQQISQRSDHIRETQGGTVDTEALYSQIESMKENIQEGMKSQGEIARLRSQVEKLTAHLAEGAAQNSSFSNIQQEIRSLGEKLQEREDARSDITALQTQIEQLRSELTDKEHKASEVSELRTQMQNLQGELDRQRTRADEIHHLKEKIASLESERLESIKDRSAAETDALKEQIATLKEELDFAHRQNERGKDIEKLKDAISRLEQQTVSRTLGTEQLERLRSEVQSLAKDAALSSEMEQKIDRIIKEGLVNLPPRDSAQIEDLASQIDSLKDDLLRLQSRQIGLESGHDMGTVVQEPVKTGTEVEPSETEGPFDTGTAFDTGTEVVSEQFLSPEKTGTEVDLPSGKQGSETAEMGTVVQEPKKTGTEVEPAFPEKLPPAVSGKITPETVQQPAEGEEIHPGYETNLNITPKTEEDTHEEFETLQEHLRGPQFEEPSEDEILEKILQETAHNSEKEYEIRGTEDSRDISDEFDISRLFAPNTQKESPDEEFYSQFMDRNRPRVKRELPILQVSFRFDKLPELSSLSKESNIIESTFYRYKHLLEKANEHIKRRQVNDALNYYETVLAQDIPEEFKKMIRQNIQDLNEYLEKYMLNM